MPASNPTRGYGVFESFLARKRSGMADRLIPAASRKGRLLDLGCGARPLFLLNTGFAEKYGLDKIVRENHRRECLSHNITLRNHDLEQEAPLPFENDFFDAVTMLGVLEHIEPELLDGILAEVRRILKPGGLFVITTPAGWTDRLLNLMAGLRLVSPVEIAEHKDLYTFEKISARLRQAGFIKEKISFGRYNLFMNIWAAAAK